MIASYGSVQFEFLRQTLENMGHVPVAYLFSRSMRPMTAAESDLLDAAKAIVEHVPPGMDLLLPGGPAAVISMLAGYQPDLLLVFGFNWRLPQDVLELPRLGVLNVHPSALPKYRGPSPVPWAIRNGDLCMGITIHRMTERIDAGPVLAQVDGLPIPEHVTAPDIWNLMRGALPSLLGAAFERAVYGDPGEPQDEQAATYAGFPPPDWYEVSWHDDRERVHNQIRVLRYLHQGEGPVVALKGRNVRVQTISLIPNSGIRVECGDGPLWVTYTPVD